MNTEKIDYWLFFTIIGLVIFGAVMISSVSIYESFMLMQRINGEAYCAIDSGNNCNSFYLMRHIWHIIFAIPIFFMGIFLPTSFFKKIAFPFFIVSLILLFSVFIQGIGSEHGTANSWIDIPGLPSVQPSEVMKLAIIFYFAIWMEKRENEVITFQQGFLPFVILLSISLLPIALQPDFGSVLVVGMIATSMFFVAGGSILHIILGTGIASVIAWPIILSHQYIRDRFMAFLNPGMEGMEDKLYHITQSKITVGSGEIWGLGIGNSGQRYGWLPEIQSDSIFAAAGEELGFIRMIFLVGVFAFIAWRGFQIAERSNDRFSKLLATGITAWISFQAIVNMAVALDLMPLTGITLPFISYGGSSLFSLMFASGILIHISMNQNESRFFYKRAKIKKGNYKRR